MVESIKQGYPQAEIATRRTASSASSTAERRSSA
jgi:hypothetical protein